MSETQTGGHPFGLDEAVAEAAENVVAVGANDDAETAKEPSHEPTEEDAELVIRDGDIFVYPHNNVIALTVLETRYVPQVGNIYRARLYSSIAEPVSVSNDELLKFIESNGLVKLVTYRDQVEAISPKMILNQGDIFTRNGEFHMEILTLPLLYISSTGEAKDVVGVRTADGVVAYRDEVWVKGAIYQNTDQFPPQGNE